MSRYTNYIGQSYFIIHDEKKFQQLLDDFEYAESLLQLKPPRKIGDGWGVIFGYKDGSTDINHFDPEDVIDFWEAFSEIVEEKFEFVCLDEEFPILNEGGYAKHLECVNGKCEITGLKLVKDDSN